jgi:hypothetical protein
VAALFDAANRLPATAARLPFALIEQNFAQIGKPPAGLAKIRRRIAATS